MFNIANKTICVLGAKRSGRALCELIQKYGGTPKISDSGRDDDIIVWAGERKILWELGRHSPEFVLASDLIVLSPGVAYDAPIVREAKKNNIAVLGEIEFSFQYCDKPVIAVTGSNGKTTVSTLIHEVLKKAGFNSCLCGNIGRPFASFCDDMTVDYFVLEMSSFQSESIVGPHQVMIEKLNLAWQRFNGFKPKVALVLNFSDNHLDRHKDLDDYFMAKTRLLVNMEKTDHVLLSQRSHHRLSSLGAVLPMHVVFFDGEESVRNFATGNPNHLAVYALAQALQIDRSVVDDVLAGFKGVEHRLEMVRTIAGVDYINDSKSTTAEAGRWALNNMAKPVFLICGGKDKNIDFKPLRELVGQKVKKLILIGEARPKLAAVFSGLVPIEEAQSLQEAVEKAKKEALTGDCVLLSPMCASFDMFKDYEDRGRVFKTIVQGLGG
jgi:UDP-N-acetylmuramoylalanine--D-glutamate ligase